MLTCKTELDKKNLLKALNDDNYYKLIMHVGAPY